MKQINSAGGNGFNAARENVDRAQKWFIGHPNPAGMHIKSLLESNLEATTFAGSNKVLKRANRLQMCRKENLPVPVNAARFARIRSSYEFMNKKSHGMRRVPGEESLVRIRLRPGNEQIPAGLNASAHIRESFLGEWKMLQNVHASHDIKLILWQLVGLQVTLYFHLNPVVVFQLFRIYIDARDPFFER